MEELHSFRGDEWNGAISTDGFGSHVISEFGGVSLKPFTLGAGAGLGGTCAHDTGVDSASDAVLLLDVDLGEVEVIGVLVSEVFFHVSPR